MNQEPCRVSDLAKMDFDESIHPRAFFDRALEISLEDWAALDRQFVAWLSKEGHLNQAKLPIHNHAKRGKYFINSKPQHSQPSFDGDWYQVGEFWVDTKYNARAHIQNLLGTLEQLGLREPHFYLAFRNGRR
jgi:hypothetical protein